MQLNVIERLIVNTPVRAVLQRYIELPLLLKMRPLPPHSRVLEIGCGRGVGLKLLHQQAGDNIACLSGCDLDPRQLERARHKVPPHTNLAAASATELPYSDSAFDAVFCFGVLHHVPNWQQALAELKRVTTPGGGIYLYEFYRASICNPLARVLFDHPQENRFNHTELRAEAERIDLTVIRDKNVADWIGYITLELPKSE